MDNKADLFKREQYIEQFCCGPMDFRGDVFIQASESGALRYSNRESCGVWLLCRTLIIVGLPLGSSALLWALRTAGGGLGKLSCPFL